MKNILNLTYEELKKEIVENLGWERYRVDQILDWIYKKKVFDFKDMTNLSKEQRRILDEKYAIEIPELIDKQISKKDGTIKYLWKLEDGNTIESVLLFYPNRVAACISTQVGCPLKCAFCFTGQSGFVRNLSAGEIVSQILAMEKESDLKIKNIVYMGMGEPFLNYDNVIKSIKILNHKKMYGLGSRHITISTVGIPDKIEQLAQEPFEIRLSISLHAPTNYQRDQIMPINRKYPIEEVIQAAKNYQKITNRRITIEYIAIKNFNDSIKDAEKLVEILKGLKVYINVIPINPNPANFEKPSRKFLINFVNYLKSKGIEAVLRAEKGADIDAACGQLRIRKGIKRK